MPDVSEEQAQAVATVCEAIGGPSKTFQERVHPWLLACFGVEIARAKIERSHRFLEEALELVQTCGCTGREAHQLVDYVYDRAKGDAHQETGGVMVTLAALCLANGLDMHQAAEVELTRVWTKVEQIRAKQAAKPKHSPLPAIRGPNSAPFVTDVMVDAAVAGWFSDMPFMSVQARSTYHNRMRAALTAALAVKVEGGAS